MIIETKFNPEDEVWCMYLNKPKQFKIYEVNVGIVSKTHRYQHSYTFHGFNGNSPKKYESELFKTKEELINSL